MPSGPAPGNAKEEALLFRLLQRRGQAQGNLPHFRADELLRRARNVPRQRKLLRQNVGGAAGQKRQRHAVPVHVSGQAVDDFVERAIAAARNHQLAALARGLLRDFRGVAGGGGFRKLGFDAAVGKNAPRLLDQAASHVSATSGIRVVNQQRVVELSFHDLPGFKRVHHSI